MGESGRWGELALAHVAARSNGRSLNSELRVELHFHPDRLVGGRPILVAMAQDGQKALKALADDEAPELVLMDIMMPVMDGYETMRAIRAQPQFASMPIIALTAKAMRGDREKCLEMGANDYLSKPIDIDKLSSMIRVWLQR